MAALSGASKIVDSGFADDDRAVDNFDQPVLSPRRHGAIFARSLFSNCDVCQIELPWERGLFKDLFGDDETSSVVPRMPLADLGQLDLDLEPQEVGACVASVA